MLHDKHPSSEQGRSSVTFMSEIAEATQGFLNDKVCVDILAKHAAVVESIHMIRPVYWLLC